MAGTSSKGSSIVVAGRRAPHLSSKRLSELGDSLILSSDWGSQSTARPAWLPDSSFKRSNHYHHHQVYHDGLLLSAHTIHSRQPSKPFNNVSPRPKLDEEKVARRDQRSQASDRLEDGRLTLISSYSPFKAFPPPTCPPPPPSPSAPSPNPRAVPLPRVLNRLVHRALHLFNTTQH